MIVSLGLLGLTVAAGPAGATGRYPITVGSVKLSKAQLEHWQPIFAGDRTVTARFLVEYRWTRGEAKRRGVRVTQIALRRAYQREVSSYSRRDVKRLLHESRQTRADLRVRVYRLEYANRLRDFALKGVPADQQQTAMAEFNREVPKRREAYLSTAIELSV